MALARSARSGELFPPLYDGERFGGTRFMPVPILLHAGVAQVTDEYLTSGKVVAYASAGSLVALSFVLLRRMGLSTGPALCLAAGFLATRSGLLAATTVEGDALAVVFQVAAVAVVAGSRSGASAVGAAALCTVALASKLSAVWAPLAICAWLLARDRRRLPLFLGALAVLVLGTLTFLFLATEGRVLGNLGELALAGVEGTSDVLRSPFRTLELIIDSAPVLLVIGPFALFAEPLLAGRAGLSIYYVALLFAVGTLLVVLSDQGTSYNHLLDVTVLAFLVVGRVWALLLHREPFPSPMRSILTLTVLSGVAVSALVLVRPPVQAAAVSVVRDEAEVSDEQRLAGVVGPAESMLSEDPYVPVVLGRAPVILDAWALQRIAENHPQWIAHLANRICDHEFDRILLVYPLDFRVWYEEVHLGRPVADAIREAYRSAGTQVGYHVYVPAPEVGETPGAGP
jgi:hypothetical protein